MDRQKMQESPITRRATNWKYWGSLLQENDTKNISSLFITGLVYLRQVAVGGKGKFSFDFVT